MYDFAHVMRVYYYNICDNVQRVGWVHYRGNRGGHAYYIQTSERLCSLYGRRRWNQSPRMQRSHFSFNKVRSTRTPTIAANLDDRFSILDSLVEFYSGVCRRFMWNIDKRAADKIPLVFIHPWIFAASVHRMNNKYWKCGLRNILITLLALKP